MSGELADSRMRAPATGALVSSTTLPLTAISAAPAGARTMEISTSTHRFDTAFPGDWRTQAHLPGIEEVKSAIAGGGVKALDFDCRNLGQWDTGLIMFVLKCAELCEQHKIEQLQRTANGGSGHHSVSRKAKN